MDNTFDKLRCLAAKLFNEDCDKENIKYKLDEKVNKILDLKDQILFLTGYPNRVEKYELNPYVLLVSDRDIEIYHSDQYEKLSGERDVSIYEKKDDGFLCRKEEENTWFCDCRKCRKW